MQDAFVLRFEPAALCRSESAIGDLETSEGLESLLDARELLEELGGDRAEQRGRSLSGLELLERIAEKALSLAVILGCPEGGDERQGLVTS